jgi:NIMA (never in mitosis gene a)-related kinase
MFFQANNETKQKLFNKYKQDAENQIQRKKYEKKIRIEEEKKYLENSQKIEKERLNKINQDKIRQKQEEKKEYDKMILSRPENTIINKSKNKEVIINNYGYSINPNKNNTINYRYNEDYNFHNNNYRKMNLSSKERELITSEDQVGILLNESSNNHKFNDYIKKLNKNKIHIYKEILDKQNNEILTNDNNKIVNGKIYRRDNPVLLRNQKKYIVYNDFLLIIEKIMILGIVILVIIL